MVILHIFWKTKLRENLSRQLPAQAEIGNVYMLSLTDSFGFTLSGAMVTVQWNRRNQHLETQQVGIK